MTISETHPVQIVREQVECYQQLAINVLEILNCAEDTIDSVRDILLKIRQVTRIEAVGIRLREGDDFPYYMTEGFPEHFVQLDRYLCARDKTGEAKCDIQGNPILECMCGNIICGRTDPTLAFFTEAGSFWSNCTTDLLASTSEKERQSRTRNRCNAAGYESVALIPLRSRSGIIGLLQLNDHRKNQFTLEMIQFFEGLGASIGIALSRVEAQRELRISNTFLESLLGHSPSPIVVWNSEYRITKFNHSLERLTGRQAAEFIGKPLEALFSSDELKALRATNENNHTSKHRESVEIPIRHVDGSIRTVLWSTSTLTDSDDKSIVVEIAQGLDITKRKQAEQELNDSKALLETVIENIPLMVFLKEAKDLRFVIFNQAGVDLLGYDRTDLLGKNNLDLFPPEQAAHFMAKDREVLDGEVGMLDIPEEPILTAKNGQRLLHTRKVCVRGADGTTKYLLGISEDITERKRVASELERSNAILSAIYNNTPSMIFAKDLDSRVVAASPTVYKLFGMEREQVVGHNDYEYLPGEIAEKIIANDQQVMRSGTAQTFEETIDSPAGPRTFYTNKSPWLDSNNDIIGTIGVAMDITELKRAMAELEQVNAILTTIYESTPTLIFAKDHDSRIVTASPTVAKLFNREKEQIVGHVAFDYAPHEAATKMVANDQEVMRSGIPQTFMETVDTPGGKRTFLTSKSPWFNLQKDVIGIIGVAMDVSEQIASEKKRKDLEKQLRQAQKLETIGTLAGGIAHDFNNILVPILIYTDELLAQNNEDKDLCQDLREIKTAAQRARDLVQQILSFSRQGECDLISVDLKPVVREAVKLCGATFPATITVDLQLDCRHCYVSADPTQIFQVLMNLLTNARQAIGDNDGLIMVRVECRQVEESHSASNPALRAGEYMVLSVEDSGSGIDPDHLEHILDPFFTTKEVGMGTGLGLSVVHGIVMSHGGEIVVNSQVGHGTTVSVYLPIVAELESMQPEKTPETSAGNEHVLVIDDEPMITRTAAKALRRFGYRVTAMNKASDAIKTFEVQPEIYDIVITDQTMPHTTGDKVLSALRLIRPDIPVIVMTGFSKIVSVENYSSLGFNGYIQKPMDPAQIHEAIRQALDRDDKIISKAID